MWCHLSLSYHRSRIALEVLLLHVLGQAPSTKPDVMDLAAKKVLEVLSI